MHVALRTLGVDMAGGMAGGAVAYALGGNVLEGWQQGQLAAQALMHAGGAFQRALLRACFARGVRVLTPEGSKPIEEIEIGDLVLSRSEDDPYGPVVAKVVKEKFVRVGRIMPLSVRGRVIGTTQEHPFYPEGRGWTAAGELRVGERLRGRDDWVEVEGVEYSGEWETVYNLHVAVYHTYFVGCEEWGFSVWAHNADYPTQQQRASRDLVHEHTQGALDAIAAGERAGLREVTYNGFKLRTRLGDPSANGRGPALAVVHDQETGRIFIRQNETFAPEVQHTLIEQGIQRRDEVTGGRYGRQYPQEPGVHAEVHALNDALLARDPSRVGLTASDLGGFTLNVVRTNVPVTDSSFGSSFIRCVNCRDITFGVTSVSDRLDSIAGSSDWATRSLRDDPRFVIPQPPRR
jgi:hypothetical protein